MMRKILDYSSHDSPYILVMKQEDEYSPCIANTLRSLREKTRSCKEKNDRLVEVRKELQGLRKSRERLM